jgi:hypothetical protein
LKWTGIYWKGTGGIHILIERIVHVGTACIVIVGCVPGIILWKKSWLRNWDWLKP